MGPGPQQQGHKTELAGSSSSFPIDAPTLDLVPAPGPDQQGSGTARPGWGVQTEVGKKAEEDDNFLLT